MSSVLAFDENNVWTFSQIGSYSHLENGIWITEFFLNRKGGILEMYSNQVNKIYFAGTNGSLTYYEHPDNSILIETNTNLDINDIYGGTNPFTNEREIYAVAAKQYENTEKAILSINEKSVAHLINEGVRASLSGIWFKKGVRYYVVGAGIYAKHEIKKNKKWPEVNIRISPNYLEAIRGNEVNDIFICGHFGELIHYNGSTWKSYLEEIDLGSGVLRAIDTKGDLVVAVGMDGWNAVIMMGKRN